MNPPQRPDAVDNVIQTMEERIRQSRQLMPDPGSHTICRFPDFLVGIDDGIRLPRLASFGPCHSGQEHLLSFDVHKTDLRDKFLSRTQNLGRKLPFYVQRLMNRIDNIRRCYSNRIVLPPDDELVEMMLLDGSFMVELFREYDEHTDVTRPWRVQNLIADLLKLENQLPFFVLEELFDSNNIGQRASTRSLPNLALRFLNQAFCNPSDMVMVNSEIQEPKHLLDLFRRSLLPSANPDPQQINRHLLMYSIQSVKYLRNAGITVRQKTAKSLLEIDFRKLHIPPLALKIPSVAIDDFTNAILLNCVAWEQCFPDKSQHFTAYVCFMSCLLKQTEDVEYLRSVDIIKGFSRDEMSFINLLNSVGSNVSFNLRQCYLWKQIREIHGYYNSYWARIRRWFAYNNIMLFLTVLQVAFAIISLRLSGK